MVALHFAHHVRGAAGAVAALAVPQAQQPHALAAARESRVEQPAVAALERVVARGLVQCGLVECGLVEREGVVCAAHGACADGGRRHDLRRAGEAGGDRAVARHPVLAVAHRPHRALDELGLVEWLQELQRHAARLRRLGEQQVATGGALGQAEVGGTGVERGQRGGDALRRFGHQGGRKTRRRAPRRVHHVPRKQDDPPQRAARTRGGGDGCGHRDSGQGRAGKGSGFHDRRGPLYWRGRTHRAEIAHPGGAAARGRVCCRIEAEPGRA